ncbi:MAG: phasin family protein [Rhodoplanes sp.]
MTNGITRPFEIPKEMRAVAEQSVEQAKLAFNNYLQAAQEAVSTFDQWVKASQVGAQGLCNKAMNFAQRNVLSAFEFAQKTVQAKDIQELIQTQTEFVQSQMQVLSEQVKYLGEAATKAAMDSLKDLGETASKTAMSVKDLGETATKTAMKNVKDLSEVATKTAKEGMKDLGETGEAA